MSQLDEAIKIVEARQADVPESVDITLDKNAFQAGYLVAVGGIRDALIRLRSHPLNPTGCRCGCHTFLQPKFSKPIGIACKLCAGNHWCPVCERNLDAESHEEECPEGLHPLTVADVRAARSSVRWTCLKCGWWKAQAVPCSQCHAWCEVVATDSRSSYMRGAVSAARSILGRAGLDFDALSAERQAEVAWAIQQSARELSKEAAGEK